MTPSLPRPSSLDPSAEDALEERALAALPWLAAACPPLWVVLAHSLAWSAMLQLGRWPRPSLDDPGAIAAPGFAAAYLVLMLGVPGVFTAAAIGLGACGWVLYRQGARAATLRALAILASLALWIALARWDPARVVEWLMD